MALACRRPNENGLDCHFQDVLGAGIEHLTEDDASGVLVARSFDARPEIEALRLATKQASERMERYFARKVQGEGTKTGFPLSRE